MNDEYEKDAPNILLIQKEIRRKFLNQSTTGTLAVQIDIVIAGIAVGPFGRFGTVVLKGSAALPPPAQG